MHPARDREQEGHADESHPFNPPSATAVRPSIFSTTRPASALASLVLPVAPRVVFVFDRREHDAVAGVKPAGGHLPGLQKVRVCGRMGAPGTVWKGGQPASSQRV